MGQFDLAIETPRAQQRRIQCIRTICRCNHLCLWVPTSKQSAPWLTTSYAHAYFSSTSHSMNSIDTDMAYHHETQPLTQFIKKRLQQLRSQINKQCRYTRTGILTTYLDLLVRRKPIELVEQLQHGALYLTITTLVATVAFRADGVEFVDEDDGACKRQSRRIRDCQYWFVAYARGGHIEGTTMSHTQTTAHSSKQCSLERHSTKPKQHTDSRDLIAYLCDLPC